MSNFIRVHSSTQPFIYKGFLIYRLPLDLVYCYSPKIIKLVLRWK